MPSDVVEFMVNVTVPAGVADAEVTVAVNVTLCPRAEGFGEETRVVVVAAPVAALTVWDSAAELLGLKLESPV